MRYAIVTLAACLAALSCNETRSQDAGGYGGGGGEYGGVGGGANEGRATYLLPPMTIPQTGRSSRGVEPSSFEDVSKSASYERVIAARRIVGFQYELGSLKPVRVNFRSSPGMGSGYASRDDMGMDGSYGGDMMGMGGMGGPGGDGGYGGDEMGMGGMGGMVMGLNSIPKERIILIYAYVGAKEQVDGRATIHLVTLPGGRPYTRSNRDSQAPFQNLASLASTEPTDDSEANDSILTPAELTIVSDTIRQTIWKKDVIRALNQSKGIANDAETEQLLKEILTEEYETQLDRQVIEVDRIERRIADLRQELDRRRAAKDRVIDVQLGRIVLESQGLLSR